MGGGGGKRGWGAYTSKIFFERIYVTDIFSYQLKYRADKRAIVIRNVPC